MNHALSSFHNQMRDTHYFQFTTQETEAHIGKVTLQSHRLEVLSKHRVRLPAEQM